MPTQPIAIAMRSFRINTHVESAFSNILFAKTPQNSSWILGPCNFGKSFKTGAFLFGVFRFARLATPSGLSIGTILKTNCCRKSVARGSSLMRKRKKPRKANWPPGTCCAKFMHFDGNRRSWAAATSGWLLQRWKLSFQPIPNTPMCMVYIYPTMWLILLVNVGTFLPYIECLEMKFIQYFRICQPCSTSLIRVFCKSFLLSLQICSGTPSIGGKDVFSAWSSDWFVDAAKVSRRHKSKWCTSDSTFGTLIGYHVYDIVIIFHTYVFFVRPKRCNSGFAC